MGDLSDTLTGEKNCQLKKNASSLNKYNLKHCLTFKIMLYILLKHQQFTVASLGHAPTHCQTSCLCVICLDSLPSQSLPTVLTKKHARNVNETASMTNHIDKNWQKHDDENTHCNYLVVMVTGDIVLCGASGTWSGRWLYRNVTLMSIVSLLSCCLCWKWASSSSSRNDSGWIQH